MYILQELMVLAGEVGRDYEHCFELQKKLDDLGSVSSLGFSSCILINLNICIFCYVETHVKLLTLKGRYNIGIWKCMFNLILLCSVHLS